jgi:diguanylate cyclase (GGDEF)-like protein/PAS domain S-box-containing protein
MSPLSDHHARLLQSGVLGVFLATADGKISDANDTFLAIVGRAPGQPGGLAWDLIVPAEHAAAHQDAVQRLAATASASSWELELVAVDGSRVPVLIGGTPLEGDNGDWVGFAIDLSQRERRRVVREVAAPAPEDRTAVMDRTGILEFLDQELPRARRSGVPLSVILAGIDKFDELLQALGDTGAQELFWAVVDRTKLGLRGYDGMGRYGDHGEFLIVLPECDMGGVLAVARRMQAAVAREPFHVGDRTFTITLSAGAVSSEDRGSCAPRELMLAADAALLRAHNRGGSRVELVTA